MWFQILLSSTQSAEKISNYAAGSVNRVSKTKLIMYYKKSSSEQLMQIFHGITENRFSINRKKKKVLTCHLDKFLNFYFFFTWYIDVAISYILIYVTWQSFFVIDIVQKCY